MLKRKQDEDQDLAPGPTPSEIRETQGLAVLPRGSRSVRTFPACLSAGSLSGF